MLPEAGSVNRRRRSEPSPLYAVGVPSDALIVDAVRSPIGKRNGSLAGIRGDDLVAQVMNGLLARHDVDPAEIEDVQMGCVTQVGEQAWNIGRNAALAAGWPVTVCGATTDRQCGSSMQTNFSAASAVMAGQLDVVVSAGVEMMSRVPMGSNNGSMSQAVYDRYDIVMQGISAEHIAERWKLSREELDRYSYESHMRAARAQDEGRFEREIIPIELAAFDPGAGTGPAPDDIAGAATAVAVAPTTFAVDEGVRRETSLEKMAQLEPAFIPGGKVTAGNSSQIVDGAAAVLLTSERAAARLGLEPRGRFLSFGLAGVDPTLMLHGNPEACEKALAKAGLDWDDMAVIEVNEAFASVVLQFLADTGLRERWEAGDVNPNGGGISLGHPLGATGARLTATLLNELERRDAPYGIAAMCIGFGQAIAGVVERF
jgi:acetyl-CoA acyltransferase